MTSDPRFFEDLAALYLQFDTPSDTLALDPTILESFTHALNQRGHSLNSVQVSKALINARKNRKLPRVRQHRV